MLKIKNLGKKHDQCVGILETMFTKFGIKPLDPDSPMQYWIVESDDPKNSLLDTMVLTEDEQKNQLRAVFFVTRKKTCKKLKLFRFTELFPALHVNEHEVTINEAIETFILEKTDYIPPVLVVCLGKLQVNDELYAGGFLYEVKANREVCFEVMPSEALKESEFPEEAED